MVSDEDRYLFVCEGTHELTRATHMKSGEPGTISWLCRHLREGDVVYDVGANIGVYTIFAAKRVGPEGHVYAFEPHAGNTRSLLRNVAANELTDRVSVISCALDQRTHFADFLYDDLTAGAGMSGLASGLRAHGRHPTSATCTELKFTTSIDTLVSEGVVRAPDLVKIDVEGAEAGVVRGMDAVLGSADSAPRTVQVEVDASP